MTSTRSCKIWPTSSFAGCPYSTAKSGWWVSSRWVTSPLPTARPARGAPCAASPSRVASIRSPWTGGAACAAPEPAPRNDIESGSVKRGAASIGPTRVSALVPGPPISGKPRDGTPGMTDACPAKIALIQRAPEATDRNDHCDQHQAGERERIVTQIRNRRALEHDPAHDAKIMGERQELADPLRPRGHAREWEHETRKQDVGQEEHHRHLHRLQLVLRDGRKGVTDRKIGGDEQRAEQREQEEAAQERHADQADADSDDKGGMHEPDDDVGDDLAEHDLDRRDRHGQKAFHGPALDLARHRERGEDQHGHGENGADQTWHDIERRVGRR